MPVPRTRDFLDNQAAGVQEKDWKKEKKIRFTRSKNIEGIRGENPKGV